MVDLISTIEVAPWVQVHFFEWWGSVKHAKSLQTPCRDEYQGKHMHRRCLPASRLLHCTAALAHCPHPHACPPIMEAFTWLVRPIMPRTRLYSIARNTPTVKVVSRGVGRRGSFYLPFRRRRTSARARAGWTLWPATEESECWRRPARTIKTTTMALEYSQGHCELARNLGRSGTSHGTGKQQ